jgi:CRP-like cAMP-binding protein
MADEDVTGEGLKERLARQGEDALGKLAQELLENPIVNGAIARAFATRERAVRTQEAAMGALNIPSAADVERLTRRLRSVSQRLEGIEDGVDRLDRRVEQAARTTQSPDVRLAAIEAQLAKLSADVANLVRGLDTAPAPVPREQERLEVEQLAPAPRRRTTRTRRTAG